MIFNEVYSAYYNAVAKIISAIMEGNTDEKTLQKIVSEQAFGESVLTLLPSLKSEKWQLIRGDMTTPLRHKPTMPLTRVQKQWLKAISLDPRVQLFDVRWEGLEDVEPLFTAEDYYIYDRYADGDPYTDAKYIQIFKTVLTALRTGKNLKIEMLSRKGGTVYARCVPERLEYSEKDDKFRLITKGCRFITTINLARITKCSLYEGDAVIEAPKYPPLQETVTLWVSEERNTLERCLMHFAHFEKRAEKMEDHYRLYIHYLKEDEPEMVIRVLSFGPTVKVLASENFKNLIIEKLKSQKSCEL